MKIIQEMIQIERPKNWCSARLVNLIVQIRDFELFNSKGTIETEKTRNKWKNFLTLKIYLKYNSIHSTLHEWNATMTIKVNGLSHEYLLQKPKS
jgi:hypothetical protein